MSFLRSFLFLVALQVNGLQVIGQTSNIRHFSYFEFFGGLGTSHYISNLPITENQTMTEPKLSTGAIGLGKINTRMTNSLGMRFQVDRILALSVQVQPVWLNSDDRTLVNTELQQDFRPMLTEISGQAEFYWLQRLRGIDPYAYLGLGGLTWMRLNLDSELEKNNYSGLVGLGGLGFRLSSQGLFTHSAEFGLRYGINEDLSQFTEVGVWSNSYACLQYKLNYKLAGKGYYSKRGLVNRSLKQRINTRKNLENRNQEEILVDPGNMVLTKKERRKLDRHIKKMEKNE